MRAHMRLALMAEEVHEVASAAVPHTLTQAAAGPIGTSAGDDYEAVLKPLQVCQAAVLWWMCL